MSAPIIRDYGEEWPLRFDELAGAVVAAIGHDVLRIDHIGSTAVPGLAAKDVIDIQVSVSSLDLADRWPDEIGTFRRQDYREDHVPPGATPGPNWHKRFWSSAEPRAHLHVREVGRANHRYAMLFRDYLRADPAAMVAYERCKRHLADLCDDSGVYSDAKDPVCDLVMITAKRWASEVGWPWVGPAAVLRAMTAAFATGRLDAVDSFVDDKYLDHQGLGGVAVHGPSGFAHVVETARRAYTHLDVSVEDIFASGDRAVARLRWRGDRAEGRALDRETIEIVRVDDGKAVEHWGGRSVP